MADESPPKRDSAAGAPPPPPPAPGGLNEDKALLVLCYLGLLSLVPYLVARGRGEVGFHARQGLALGLAGIGCAALAAVPLVGVFGMLGVAGAAILSILGIVQALSGRRWRMPIAAALADRLAL